VAKKKAKVEGLAKYQEQAQPYVQEATGILAAIADAQVTCQADVDAMTAFRAATRSKRLHVTELRDSILDPMTAAVKAVRGVFNPPIETYQTVESQLEAKIQAHVKASQAALLAATTTEEVLATPALTLAAGTRVMRRTVVEIQDRDACMEALCARYLVSRGYQVYKEGMAQYAPEGCLQLDEVAIRRLPHDQLPPGCAAVEKETML
jgi:hypothetical protein